MNDFLIYTGYLILLINLILYTYSFFRKGKANGFFVSYIYFLGLISYSMELLYIFKTDNLILVNLLFVGQMVLLSFFYNSIYEIKSQKLFVRYTVIAALSVLAVQFVIKPGEFLKFNLLEITITSLLLVVYALLHLYNMLTETKRYYYISIGIILYFLSSTVLFIIGNLTKDLSDDLKFFSWMLNAFLFIVYQFFILYDWKISFAGEKEQNLSNN